jgi:CheY-like chemotaxis protein
MYSSSLFKVPLVSNLLKIDHLSIQSEVPELRLPKQFHFLLADDDNDDRFFFEKALKNLLPLTKVSFVEDGEKLMTFLAGSAELPDVLFLDLNMPRKNGHECLKEIKLNAAYSKMAIIIYSTSAHDNVADVLYENGAHYYIRKPDLIGLQKVLQHVLFLLIEERIDRPARDKFVLKAP